jgi:hypothetical protein
MSNLITSPTDSISLGKLEVSLGLNELRIKLDNPDDIIKPEVWRSTPNLENYLETNGRGDFRDPKTLKRILLKSPYRDKKRARLYIFRDELGNKRTVSLQKFVALIYHPNPYNATSTYVLDGNRDNLHRSNVDWYFIGGYKY